MPRSSAYSHNPHRTRGIGSPAHAQQHTRGTGDCECTGRLDDCLGCGGKACVHYIFASGERFCEHCGAGGATGTAS